MLTESRPKTIAVTVVSKMKHGDLFAAVGKVGSQRALADRLGVGEITIGEWCNLNRCPPVQPTKNWPQERIDKLEKDLFELTGKLLEDLFPEGLRAATAFLASEKRAIVTKQIEIKGLTRVGAKHLERIEVDPTDEIEAQESSLDAKQVTQELLKCLAFREREIIKMRFGMGDGYRYTLDEIAHTYKIGRERVRQIEAKALRKMQVAAYKQQPVAIVEGVE